MQPYFAAGLGATRFSASGAGAGSSTRFSGSLAVGVAADLAMNENERASLTLLYTKAMADFRSKPAIAGLPLLLQKRLKQATERLHKALGEQARLLARFRHVTEGLVKAIAETVAARIRRALPYVSAEDVIVAPDQRGTGLGQYVMDAVMAHPQVAAVRHVELQCKPELDEFYRRWGFAPVEGILYMRRSAT